MQLFSFYSILYYLSGLICPVILCLYSINNFTYYKFSNFNTQKIIKGRNLFLLAFTTLGIISYMLFSYIFMNVDLFINLFISESNTFKIQFVHQIIIILIFSIFLIFRKTRLFIKKLVLLNFLLISAMIWYSNINNIQLNNELVLFNFLNLKNFNFNNIIYLFTIECLYFLWSFVSNKNNLSDWTVKIPLKNEVLYFFRITLFYLFIMLYYSLLE